MLLKNLRVSIRNSQQLIIDHLTRNFIERKEGKAKKDLDPPICNFCASNHEITKEHVLPRWAFERKPNRTFVTQINGLSHFYERTTIPACKSCNNVLLSGLEKRVIEILDNHNLPSQFFRDDEIDDLIRWLETIDYKYQMFSLRTRFRVSKKGGHIPFLEDYSLSVLDSNVEYSPYKVITAIRQSLLRIAVRSKEKSRNSLVVFRTSNPDNYFFHKNNDYIFLEMPKKKVALFYFYKRTFDMVEEARDAALELIKTHY